MATLTNPVGTQNIVDRFADYVVVRGNSSIAWGTNAVPTASTGPVSGVADTVNVIDPGAFGGTTGGKAIGISGGNIAATPITASTIYNTLVAETNAYTRIRLVRGILNVTGAGGNTGSRLRSTGAVGGRTEINVFDSTQMANMNGSYLQSIGSPSNAGVSSGNTISSANLETLFDNLRTALTTARSNVNVYTTSVCHASCHSSCHSSRGRR